MRFNWANKFGKKITEIIFKRKVRRSLRTRGAMEMRSSLRKFHTHDPLKFASCLEEIKRSLDRGQHKIKISAEWHYLHCIIFITYYFITSHPQKMLVWEAKASLKTSGVAAYAFETVFRRE